jgi:hypothetical protein
MKDKKEAINASQDNGTTHVSKVDTKIKLSENPNIGALGTASYQEANLRIKGFCGEVIESEDQYLQYYTEKVLTALNDNPETSRIIDRAIVNNNVNIQTKELPVPLSIEAVVPLGGDWEGYSWVMMGTNMPGRILSDKTMNELVRLAQHANEQNYENPRALPSGYKIEVLKETGYSNADLYDLAQIFKDSFTTYISDLFSPKKVDEWLKDPSVYPIIIRNNNNQIVAVSSGDLGEIDLNGKLFKFMEIGDSAGNPKYRGMGLNRNIKHALIEFGVKNGFHSIHAETRSAWAAPNYGNAKNGMIYYGTLPLNCKISGEETVAETADPNIYDHLRIMGSLNIWAMTEKNKNWEKFIKND